MLKLTLISDDPALYQLCRDILAESLGTDYELRSAGGNGCLKEESDLSLWDFAPGLSIPAPVESEPYKHLFLVHRKDLESFLVQFPRASAGILLKPVTRATLGAFVDQWLSKSSIDGSQVRGLRADRDEILQTLILASLKLQEYDQDRTRFLTRAIHDFRAPLTAVAGYCGLMLGEQLGPLTRDQKEALQRMQHSAKRLSRMSTAMFQLGVARQCEMPPVLCAGDLQDCIDQSLHELMQPINEKDLAISVELTPCAEVLYFDPSQIQQVFLNLLDNASRFTPRSGSVEISGYPHFWERRLAPMNRFGHNGDRRKAERTSPNTYRIDIRDTGPGIPPEHLAAIFEEYTSYSGGQDRSGGGLGLAICKMIVGRHGGRIWAETSPAGAVFSFVLPLARMETPSGARVNTTHTIRV